MKLNKPELKEFIEKYLGEKSLDWSEHAQERIKERVISRSDIDEILAGDFEITSSKKGKYAGECKYKICGYTKPSPCSRMCIIIVINTNIYVIKIVTVMWEEI